jgi:hypothetical protein
MAIAKTHTSNLETLRTAFERDDVALVECQRVSDGETVVMLCAVGFDGEEYGITPFAEMVNGNPFELYRPPNPDGGYHPPDSEDPDGRYHEESPDPDWMNP